MSIRQRIDSVRTSAKVLWLVARNWRAFRAVIEDLEQMQQSEHWNAVSELRAEVKACDLCNEHRMCGPHHDEFLEIQQAVEEKWGNR